MVSSVVSPLKKFPQSVPAVPTIIFSGGVSCSNTRMRLDVMRRIQYAFQQGSNAHAPRCPPIYCRSCSANDIAGLKFGEL
ncbi:hypothetical protein FKM82_020927 [Ascaphus truei]